MLSLFVLENIGGFKMNKKISSVIFTGVLLVSTVGMSFTYEAKAFVGTDGIVLKENNKDLLGQANEINKIMEYVKLNLKTNEMYIENSPELKLLVDQKTYSELVKTIEKMNNVLDTEEGKVIQQEAMEELNYNNQLNSVSSFTSKSSKKKVGSCGGGSLAGFAHTTAFTGLMTVAGVSGPVGWALGAGVGAVWLGASAAAGCLK